MELTITQTEFNNRINEFVTRGNDIVASTLTISTDEQLQTLRESTSTWRKDCMTFLQQSFAGDNSDDFATSFNNGGANTYNFPRPEIKQKANAIKESLNGHIEALKYFPKAVQYSDAIINPKKVEEEHREKWTIEQKKKFILRLLYKLGHGPYYDLAYYYSANGLKMTSDSEVRQVAKQLSDYGYIEIFNGTMATITIEGISYVEQLEVESEQKEKDEIKEEEKNEINEKLAKLEEMMNQNNYGNEIIYAELLELRQNKGGLNLKNWKQLATGKLLALHYSVAEDQAKDKIKDMLNYIVENGINLLGG